MGRYQCFEVHRLGSLTVIHLTGGKLCQSFSVQQWKAELARFIARENPDNVLINFGQVTQCSSEAIGALIDLKLLVTSDGGRLKLCGLREEIRRVFQILRLDGTVFDIYDSASAAMAAFESSAGDR